MKIVKEKMYAFKSQLWSHFKRARVSQKACYEWFSFLVGELLPALIVFGGFIVVNIEKNV